MNTISKVLTTLAIIGIGAVIYGRYKNISNKEKAKVK